MKKTTVFLVMFIASISSLLSQEQDTVWTRDLWELGSQINQVQFTPDGMNIAVAIGGGVYVFDKITGQMVKQFNKYMSSCNSFVIIPEQNRLITTSDGTKVIVWDYNTQDTIIVFRDISIFSIKKVDLNKIVGIGNLPEWQTDSSRIDIFDFETGTVIKSRKPIEQNKIFIYSSLAISKDKNLLAAMSYSYIFKNYQVELFDLTTLEAVKTLGSHSSLITDLTFSNDGKYLASASSDGIIKIWDVEKKMLSSSFIHKNMQDGYLKIKFSPNEGFIVSSGGGPDLFTNIFSLINNNLIYQYSRPFGSVYGLDISEDSSLIVVSRSRTLVLLKGHWTPTSINKPNIEILKTIFPNPTGNLINIPIEAKQSPQSINLYSMTGILEKEINNLLINENYCEINISDLTPGIYILSVIYPDRTECFKFEKN